MILAVERVGAGALGFLIVIALGVATVLLIRNMHRRLKRLPSSFDDPAATPDPSAPGDSASGPSAGS